MSTIDAFLGPAAPQRDRKRWPGFVLAAGVLALTAVAVGEPPSTERPFDPTSVDAVGLRGVVDVLRELGVEVTVTDDPAVAAGADSVLVPPLGWPDELITELAGGGARVVAVVPPLEDATPLDLGVSGVGLIRLPVGDCALLPDVETLRAPSWPGWRTEHLPGDIPAEDQCLTREGTSWLTRVDVGDGELVALGSMLPLLNARLVDSDAAIAAVRLLAPTGTEQVVVLSEPDLSGEVTLTDLIDPRWFDSLWLSLGALLLLAMARGRRLGRPVSEHLPVRVPSGELARAIGDLRHRAGHDDRAAASLRQRTLVDARRRLGLPPDADADAVLEAIAAARGAVSPAIAAALRGERSVDADGLVATARALAELRLMLRPGAQHPTPTDPSLPRNRGRT